MSDIKTAFERSVKALTLRPSIGRGTSVTTVRMREGLVCEISSGRWNLVADLPASSGGTASGPTPSVLGRAALGSCLAIGYQMRAAARGVAIRSLEVVVECDYDEAGLYGTADVPAGYSAVRYSVTIESDAPESEVRRVIEDADAHSPWLDMFANAKPVTRTLHIVGA
jgi:uncharacterized OsmC-like protein